MSNLVVLAASTNMETIKSAMSSAFSDVSTNVSSMIATSVPYALAVVGLVLATTIGIKTFKKIAGQA
jgi:hypothetical protein